MLISCDCLEYMKTLPDNSVDLVFCSPPYEDARLYGNLGFKISGQDWVDWCIPRFQECYRACKGLVAWVVEGKTRNFRYSATPALLMADLHRQDIHLRKPAAFYRHGIPGSGGPEWLKNNWEWIICASKGRLPWSDPTACGHEQKYKNGGAVSYRTREGIRVDGTLTKDRMNVSRLKRANPGNVIRCKVGGGRMGDPLAHDNEAPFPESLAEFFIKSFCPPGGLVLDPFCGSGTTCAVAKKTGRRWLGVDIREDQILLSQKRLDKIQ